jgi:hypothetical protein
VVEAQFGFELVGGFSCGNIWRVDMVVMSPRQRPKGDPPPIYSNPLNWAQNFNKKSAFGVRVTISLWIAVCGC